MNEKIKLDLTIDELHMIHNALNEICHGVDVPDFELRIGHSPEDVIELLNKIHEIYENYYK